MKNSRLAVTTLVVITLAAAVMAPPSGGGDGPPPPAVAVDAPAEPEAVPAVPPPAALSRRAVEPVARGEAGGGHRRQLRMQATGYAIGDGFTPGTLTYTGIPARRGVAAVDPEVIPLGTRLYVEGYGPALAADTGGAIQGLRIDLAFDSVDEALQWGVREVVVSILDDEAD